LKIINIFELSVICDTLKPQFCESYHRFVSGDAEGRSECTSL
jgi:hypothetical protein